MKGDFTMTPLTKYEQETIINFNAESTAALVYTRDKTIIRKFNALVTAYPDVYKCIAEIDIDKTYVMPKKYVNYCKPRKISEKRRKGILDHISKVNNSRSRHIKEDH